MIVTAPHICILMGTYNGARFLQVQLDSFLTQTHQNWSLHVSDDGSSDETVSILKAFQEKIGTTRVFISQGPRKGFCANFLSLITREAIEGDYYAFSDQDDVWESDKLTRAIACIKNDALPRVYCGRTLLVNEKNEPIGFSSLRKRAPSFQNALVQSIASGNTMLLNHSARMLLKKYSVEVAVISHDWWAYLVVTGCGGKVFYDAKPTIRYRQHGNNLIGENRSVRAKLSRLILLTQGRFKQWLTANLKALLPVCVQLTPENQKSYEMIVKGCLWRSKVYRQSVLGTMGIYVALVFMRSDNGEAIN